MKRKYNRDEAIVAAINSGASFVSIGRDHGVSGERIRQIASRLGARSRYSKVRLTAEMVERAVSLYERGMPITHIAEEIGSSYQTVRKHLNNLGLYQRMVTKPAYLWDRASDDLLRAHYNSYRGAVRDLANRFGTTRNAIIGRAHRLGLQKGKTQGASHDPLPA